ncbi:MAG: two-component sensor histidine kinase [Bifidobacteriaceae bacterium]|jgi:signal transduction histidine kinase|nr:two-component sensor histidine kinase [Bifidobacteriaceae bacterium]
MARPAQRPPGPGLTARLMALFGAVIALVGGAAWAVAAIVGPGAFHRHMVAAGLAGDAAALAHAEAAFGAASGTSLGIALAVGAAAALGLSVLITRRLGRVIGLLSQAAGRIADGEFAIRIPRPNLGAEFDGFAESFNHMGAALAASQRLRDRLLGDVAHELRTPVATINAYLEAIEDGIAQLDAETVAVLRAQGERLARLASDLAAVARAQDPLAVLQLQPANPAGLLAEAAQAARPAFAAKGVALALAPGADRGGAPRVRADRARLAQVLANLLENALRHTPPGGRVELSAGAGPAGSVLIEVADTGEGIAGQHLELVFERFYRVDEARDRAHGGAGIGLAIAKALVEAHGGRISARSAGPGQGAVFSLELPAA